MTRKNWILIAGVLGVSLLLVATGVALLLFSGGLPDRSVMVIELRDELPERPSSSLLEGLFGETPPTVFDVVDALDRAAGDERVPAVLLRFSEPVCCGIGRADEIREAIGRYRAAGGRVAAMLEGGWIVEYYVATAADEIHVLPGSGVDLTGLVMVMPFFRGVLDTVGVTAQFERSVPGKDSPDIYTEKEMRPEMRADLQRVLDDLHAGIRRRIAESRGLTDEAVQELLDRGLLTAEQSLELGLVDGIGHADQVLTSLREQTGGEELERIGVRQFLEHEGPGWFDRDARVALVHLSGVILHGDDSDSGIAGKVAGAASLGKTLRQVREDDDIDAVILRIDSPGGSAAAAEVMWREVRLTREKKPVVVSVGNYAASGGYYVAAAADAVVAQPSSLTGSIGVYSGKFAFQGMYDWIGMGWGLIKAADNADLYVDMEPWTDEQRSIIRDRVLEVHRRFRGVVGEARGLEGDRLDRVATGQVWAGAAALEAGLVDRVGGFETALAIAREKAGIDPDARVRIEVRPRRAGLLARLTGGDASGTARPLIEGRMGEALSEAAILERLSRETVMAYWPARLAHP